MSAFAPEMERLKVTEKVLVRDGKRLIRQDLKAIQAAAEPSEEPETMPVTCSLVAFLCYAVLLQGTPLGRHAECLQVPVVSMSHTAASAEALLPDVWAYCMSCLLNSL